MAYQSRVLGRVVPTWAKRVSQRWLAESVTAVMDAMFTPVDGPWHCGYTAYISVRRLLLITDVNENNMLESKIKKNDAIFQSPNNYVQGRIMVSPGPEAQATAGPSYTYLPYWAY